VTDLAELLVAMIAELPQGGGDLVVSGVELALPIESRLDAAGTLQASWPRGRMITGFDPPLGTIEVTIDVTLAGEDPP